MKKEDEKPVNTYNISRRRVERLLTPEFGHSCERKWNDGERKGEMRANLGTTDFFSNYGY